MIIYVARVRHRGEKNPLSYSVFYLFGKYGETRNSCLLLVEKWNGSRHLVFGH
jgi:hypothetical protein